MSLRSQLRPDDREIAGHLMRTDFLCSPESAPLPDVLASMDRTHVDDLPVIRDDGVMTGIVRRSDVRGRPGRWTAGEVARRTLAVLKDCVPPSVPGIAFLSGGQSDEEATAHLDAMNRMGPLPWKLTFSYGRALQAAPQKAWSGKSENVAAGQRAFTHRARMNALASRGEWATDLEKKAAYGW